tara:strand:- start:149 stop:880 length:732 start_codon:yes stop_codon:yes gene_type:complete
MENLNIVGIKEISDISKEEEKTQNLSLMVEKKNQEELKNIEEKAFEKPKVEITKKKRKKPRGASQKDPEKMKDHMRKMREKAKESKARKKEERQRKKEELESLKLAKKMGISMESLLEYEQKRKQIREGKKYLDNERKEIVETNEISKVIPQKKVKALKNEPIDYDRIADLVFNRFKTHEEAKKQQKIQQQEQEKMRIQQMNEKKQQRLYQQNKHYYRRLGRPNMNKRKDDDDAWVSLFRKKR